MAQQTIGIGAAPNDGTGDPIRDAFDKCNDNFTELYGSLAGLLDFQGATDCSANPNYPAASQGDIYIVSVAGKIGGASGKDVEVGDFYLALADNVGGAEASVGTSWAVLQANITGGIGSGVDVEDEGVSEATGATTLNFTGAGVTATDMGGGVVDVAISGGGAASGTSFPGSPSDGDLFYRTDRQIEYFYQASGTRWLSTQILGFAITTDAAVAPTADFNIYAAIPFKGTYDIYLERLDVSGYRSAAGEWDFVLYWANAAASYTALVTIDGSGTASANWVAQSGSINAVLDSTAQAFRLTFDEISGSTSLLGAVHLTYRLVG